MLENLLHKLTIIIPTHNRPEALKRNLEYIKKIKIKSNIIIVDSSKKKKNYLKDYEYFYIPNKNANIKIFTILGKIKTKYVFTVADDDLLIPSGLIKCMLFLEKNKKFIGAHGKYFTHSKLINLDFLNIYKYLPIAYRNYDYDSEKQKSFNRSLEYLNGKMAPTNYAVFKSSIFKKVWKLATKTKSQKVIFLETIPNVLFYYFGNVKCLNTPFLTRERSFRTDAQKEFTDTKSFKIAKKFLIKFMSNEKNVKNKDLILLNQILKKRINKETLKIKKKSTSSNLFYYLYKAVIIIYYFLGQKFYFDKKTINKVLKKYPKVIDEIRNTEMK